MSASVIQLPTAARRKVQQRSVAAVRAFKAAHPWPGSYQSPSQRASERMVASAGRSPELLILLALLKALPEDQCRAVQDTVHRVHFAVGDDVSLAAAALIAGLRP